MENGVGDLSSLFLSYATYAVIQVLLIAAVLDFPFVFRFFAPRAKKRKTDKMSSTLLPQAISRVSGTA